MRSANPNSTLTFRILVQDLLVFFWGCLTMLVPGLRCCDQMQQDMLCKLGPGIGFGLMFSIFALLVQLYGVLFS